MSVKNLQTHVYFVIGVIAILTVGIVYPFLPGSYDSLAMPLSTMLQTGGILGLLLVPVGIIWLFRPSRAYLLARIAAVIGGIIAVILSLVALGSVGTSFALIVFTLFVYATWEFLPRMRRLKNAQAEHGSPAPLYLIFIPLTLVFLQLFAAAPVTEWSRNRAIANSAEFVSQIEAYREQYGRYPVTLLAQHKDYYPDVVSVEKYHYSPQGESYNLFFEQPRFFLDKWGTREWVVYNPHDEHRMYSHTAWHMLLTPEEQERGQGWYAVHDAPVPHWRSFLFD